MAVTRLTETAIRAAIKRSTETKKRLELVDPDLQGLRLRLTPAGTATWVLGCRDAHGVARRFRLGQWPDQGLSQARDQARKTRTDVRQGLDPIADGRRKRAATKYATAGVGTLSALLQTYEAQAVKQMRSWPECKRRIESVFAKHLKAALTATARSDLQATVDAWPSAQSGAAAVRYIRPVLKWAAHRELAPEALTGLVPPATATRRKRVLTRDELASLLPVLRVSDRPYAAAFRFLLLTLTRREEAAGCRWRDVDLAGATWSLSRTKNDLPHVVPLSRQAVELLEARRPKKPKPADLVFKNNAGGTLSNWDRETKILMKDSSTGGWTRHDLRRSAATMLGEMGELPDIIEAALNHVSIRSPIAATYNRSRYRPQVAAALQRLADELDRIERLPNQIDGAATP